MPESRREETKTLNRRLVVLAILLAAPACGAPQAPPGVSAGSSPIDLSAGTWITSSGQPQNAPDPAKQRAGQVLEWRYVLGSQPVFLAKRQLAGKYSGMDTISFSVKSGREGTLMIRLGTSAGKNYVASFQAGPSWKEIAVRIDSFLAENGGGPLTSAAMDSLLLADLSGQRGESAGTQTVWLTDLRLGTGGPVSSSGSGSGQSAAADVPTNYAGTWTASGGTVRLTNDPLKQIAAEILEWRYQIGPQPVFIADQRLAGKFSANAAGITFRARSDKDGLLFLRLVTSSGSFIVNLTATPTWQMFTFGFDQFLPEKGQGRVDPSRIQGIALADLNGEKKTLSGARTIWLTRLAPIGQNRQPL